MIYFRHILKLYVPGKTVGIPKSKRRKKNFNLCSLKLFNGLKNFSFFIYLISFCYLGWEKKFRQELNTFVERVSPGSETHHVDVRQKIEKKQNFSHNDDLKKFPRWFKMRHVDARHKKKKTIGISLSKKVSQDSSPWRILNPGKFFWDSHCVGNFYYFLFFCLTPTWRILILMAYDLDHIGGNFLFFNFFEPSYRNKFWSHKALINFI